LNRKKRKERRGKEKEQRKSKSFEYFYPKQEKRDIFVTMLSHQLC
jgi:hypothetical protein